MVLDVLFGAVEACVEAGVSGTPSVLALDGWCWTSFFQLLRQVYLIHLVFWLQVDRF